MTFWGSASRVEWEPPRPAVPLRLVAAVALLVGAGIAWYRYVAVWTPLQRHYLGAYVRSAAAFTPGGAYAVGRVIEAKTSRLVTDDDLVTVTSAAGETTFALSAAATRAGAAGLVWQEDFYEQTGMHALLQTWVYRDQSLLALAAPAWSAALTLFLGALFGTRAQAAVEALARRRQAHPWRSPAPPATVEYGDHPPSAVALATVRTVPQTVGPTPASPARVANASVVGPGPTDPVARPETAAVWPHPVFR